jgi:hypothetical protein
MIGTDGFGNIYYGWAKTPTLEADEDPRFLRECFRIATLAEWPFGALCFRDMEGYAITGTA